MHHSEQIITVKGFCESRFKEKNSLFIGQVYPVESFEEADKIVAVIRKEHFNAAHCCNAIKIDEDKVRYSDDGEPSGTAGIRILNAIEHFNIVKVLVVSIRYFGGIKLGVGPLGKAYYRSAFETLNDSVKITKKAFHSVKIEFPADETGHVHKVLTSHKIKIKAQSFKENFIIDSFIPPSLINVIENELTEITRGKVIVSSDNEIIYF